MYQKPKQSEFSLINRNIKYKNSLVNRRGITTDTGRKYELIKKQVISK